MSDEPALVVRLGDRSYPIHLGAGLLERAGELIAPLLRTPRVYLVTDAGLLATPHPARLSAGLAEAGLAVETLPVPAGESSKSFAGLEQLIEALLERGIERHSTILALGGGVVGDLAGFAAAVVLRGVDYVQIPTTLLAQVDSAVGGKTGINTRHGKNLVGAFKQPRAVVVDVSVLDSLPARELRAGYAEIVKYGCIRDAAFFAWLEAHGPALLAGDPGARVRAVRRALEIKAEIVARDEREESGERALLNFGHTFAHAYEALAGYGSRLLHGEAVAIGMVRAASLSARLGLAPEADTLRLRRHLETVGLPVSPRDRDLAFAPEALLASMRHDKKIAAGRLRFVLWRGIGEAMLTEAVRTDVLLELLAAD